MPITVRVEAVDGRFVVAAPYNKPLVESLKSIDGRQYDRATRSWLYPATPCSAGDIARAVRNVRGQLLPDHSFAALFSAHVRALGVITGKRRANDYDTTTSNMLHQDIGLTMIDVLPGCYLSWQMGCLDCETEYLTPTGWRRIDEYDGGVVAQWDPRSGEASFVRPTGYIRKPAKEMLHISGTRGTDQVVSPDHRVPLVDRRTCEYRKTVAAKDLLLKRLSYLPCRYTMSFGGQGIALTDDELKLQVAVMADGHFPGNSPYTHRCYLRVKKERKKHRIERLLKDAGRPFDFMKESTPGFIKYAFSAPFRFKRFPESWLLAMTDHQRDVICHEIFRWDGTQLSGNRGKAYFSRHRSDADFVQILLASRGEVVSVSFSGGVYVVTTRGTRVRHFAVTPKNISNHRASDGYQYCFEVPSTFLVLRRNGKIFITGNTGKSKSVVDAVCVLGMQRTLIVCPKAVIPEWVGQFKLHGDGSAVVVPLDKSQSILNRKLADCYDDLPEKVVYVVNYEAVWRKALAEFVMARTWSLVVADEAQKIKEASSRVTKFLVELAKRSEKRVALSGTPISNVPTDLYSQMLFVDPGLFGTSFLAFRSRYCVFGGFKKEFERKCGCTRENAGIPNPDCPACGGNGTYFEKQAVNIVGYKNLGYMANRLFFVCHRITKAEALDLPSEVDQEISVEIGKEARKIYEDLDSSFVAKVRSGEITVANALTELLRLQQLLGGDAVLDDGTHEVVDRGKADALKTVLETLSAGDNPEPVVVFCRFRHDLDAVHEVAAELSMGSAELSGRRKETEYWKAAGPECTVLATQISAGGLGVNLVRSCYAIYYSLGFSMGSYLQARSRLHRKGQTRSVTNIHLIVRRWFAEPTVDEKVFASIRRKIKYADEVLKDDTSVIGDIVNGIASTPAKTAERS